MSIKMSIVTITVALLVLGLFSGVVTATPSTKLQPEKWDVTVKPGDTFTVTFTAKNEGSTPNDHGWSHVTISVENGLDIVDWTSWSSRDVNKQIGEKIWHKNGYQFPAKEELIELYSSFPSGTSKKVKVKFKAPNSEGDYLIKARFTLVDFTEDTNWETANYYRDPAPEVSTITDQQGHRVMPIKVHVKTTKPSPKIIKVNYTPRISLGEWTEIYVKAKNEGEEANWQTISISFPQNPKNVKIISDDLDSAKIYKPGDENWCGYGSYKCKMKYPMAEGWSEPWSAGEDEYLKVKVKPEKAGDFKFYVKSVAGRQPDGKCYSWDPKSGTKDQQDEYVKAYTIKVEHTISTITSYSPTSSSISLKVGETQDFSLYATNPDGCYYAVDWYVDGSYKDTGNTFSIVFSGAGTFTVEARVYDTNDPAKLTTKSWTVTVTEPNTAPSASRYSPSSSSVSLTKGDSKTFKVKCTDSEGNLRGVDWYLDGQYQDHGSPYPISGSSAINSWSYTFNNAGTYTVEAQCWDDADGDGNEDLYSSPIDWTVKVEPPKGSLKVNVKNTLGYPLPDCGGKISVNLYKDDGRVTKTKTYSGGESSVQVQFDNLANKECYIEVTQTPNAGMGLTEFWGGKHITVSGSTTVDFVRHTQWISGVKINGKSPYGNEIKVTKGEKVHVDLTVQNDEKVPKDVKVKLILDRDKTKPYDFQETHKLNIEGNKEGHFGYDFKPDKSGTYNFYVIVYGYYNGKYQVVDQHNWYKGFKNPSLNIDVYTEKGGVGKNNKGGSYYDGEVIHFYVDLTQDGKPLSGVNVGFDGGYCLGSDCKTVTCYSSYDCNLLPEFKKTNEKGKIEFTTKLFSKGSGKYVVVAYYEYEEGKCVRDKVYVNIIPIQEWENPYNYFYNETRSIYTDNNFMLAGDVAESKLTGAKPPHSIKLNVVSSFLGRGNGTASGGYLIISNPWKPDSEGEQKIRFEGDASYSFELRSGEGLGFTKSFATGVVVAKLIDVTEGEIVAKKNEVIFAEVSPSSTSVEDLSASLIKPGAGKLSEDLAKSVGKVPKLGITASKLVKGANIALTLADIGTMVYEYYHPVEEHDADYPFVLTLDANLNKNHEYRWLVMYISSSGASSLGIATSQSFVSSKCTLNDIRIIRSGVDTTPPTINKIDGPTKTTHMNDVNLEWNGNDNKAKSSELEYSYKLLGYSTDWSEWSKKNSKQYENLPQGDYTFKVRAKDPLGNIGKAKLLHFSVIKKGKMVANTKEIKQSIEGGSQKEDQLSIAAIGEEIKDVKVFKISGPPWVTIDSKDLGDIPLGENKVFTLRLSPPKDVDGSYSYSIKVEAKEAKPSFIKIKGEVRVVSTQKPIADPGGPYKVGQGEKFQLDVTGSKDRDEGGERITEYEWSCEGISGISSSAQPTVKAPSSPGNYKLKLRVKDDEGDWSNWEVTKVIVEGILPDYDKNNNGKIERTEAIEAVNDFLLRQKITKDQAIKVVNAYLLGKEV